MTNSILRATHGEHYPRVIVVGGEDYRVLCDAGVKTFRGAMVALDPFVKDGEPKAYTGEWKPSDLS